MGSRTRITASMARRPLHLISTVLLAQTVFVHSGENHFCGDTWVDAFENCHAPCPQETDAECPSGMSCHGYTGCAAKWAESAAASGGGNNGGGNGNGNNGIGGGKGDGSGGGNGDGIFLEDDTYKNNMCGISWLTAMLSCSTPCPPGTSCPGAQTCFAATNCDKPIEPIISKMVMSLLGDYEGKTSMSTVERGVFSDSILEFLAEKLEENKVAIGGADVTGQEFVEQGGRRLGERGISKRFLRQYGNNYTMTGSGFDIEFSVGDGRRLPTYSSALDVSMTITGEYRPPPYQDVDLIVEDSINRASANMIGDLRRRGGRSGTPFFERVDDLSAMRVSEVTERPTKRPTEWPTESPSNEPTETPTDGPSKSPTDTPSLSPTRNPEQVLQTGSGSDLYADTAKSFGNLFEVKTKSSSETVLIKGLDFYSSAEPNTRVQYEVWTKEGPWAGTEGKLKQYTKIAEGSAKSKGVCEEATAGVGGVKCDENFVQIPFTKFESVPVKGGGETRSFYITLTTKDIMYMRGKGSGNQMSIQANTVDIEVYEGAGVLAYPFTDAIEDYHYSRPRGFLGRVWYERNPCQDGGNEWPCTTRSPITLQQATSKKPTQRPTPRPTKRPTGRPTSKPVVANVQQQTLQTPTPTLLTTPVLTTSVESNSPVKVPATPPPTSKPVYDFEYNEEDVIQSNIIVRLHNVLDQAMILDGTVMNEREQNKYSEILIDYLRSHPSIVGANVDVLNVTIWHQEAVIPQKIKRKKAEDTGKSKKGTGKGRKRALRALHQKGERNSAFTKKLGRSEEGGYGRKRVLRALQEKVDGTAASANQVYWPEEGDEAIGDVPKAEESSTFPITDTENESPNSTNEVDITQEEAALAEQPEDAELLPQSLEDTGIDYSLSSPSSTTVGKALSMDVTTIIHTVNSVLPDDVTDVLLLHVIGDDDEELLDKFHEESFFSFFEDIDDISGRIIADVTKPPTASPTTLAQFLVSVNSDIGEEVEVKDATYNIYVWVGLIIGCLWGILTIFSVCHLGNVRMKMKNERQLSTRQKGNTNGALEASAFDSLIGGFDKDDSAGSFEFTAKTHHHEDMTSSGGSGGDEEDQVGAAIGGSESDQAMFGDLFGRVSSVSAMNTGAGNTDSGSDNKRPKGSTFNERLQGKMSMAGGGAPSRSNPQTSNTNFHGSLQKRHSSTSVTSNTNFEDRLQKKLSSTSVTSNTNFEDRLNKKLSSTSVTSNTNFEDRLQKKLSSNEVKSGYQSEGSSSSSDGDSLSEIEESERSGASVTLQGRHSLIAGGPSLEERLLFKMSAKATTTASNTNPRKQRHSIIGIPSTTKSSAKPSRRSSDGDTKSDTKQRKSTDEGNVRNHRRASNEHSNSTAKSSVKPSRRLSDDVTKSDTKQRKITDEGNVRNHRRKSDEHSNAHSSRSHHSKQSTKKTKKNRQNNKGPTRRPSHDKGSGGIKSSGDLGGGGHKASSKDKDMGTNMVEMLFA